MKTKKITKGAAGNGILYFVILLGAVIIGVMFAGSVVPTQQLTNRGTQVVTIIPPQQDPTQSAIQLKTFQGVTGIPATPTLHP